MTERCNIPPIGWYCSRAPSHEGPCAARAIVRCEVEDLSDDENQCHEACWQDCDSCGVCMCKNHLGGREDSMLLDRFFCVECWKQR